MITHYDMTTGEEIEAEGREEPVNTPAGPAGAASLRLMTVQEAAALQAPARGVPADVVTIPIEVLISRWS